MKSSAGSFAIGAGFMILTTAAAAQNALVNWESPSVDVVDMAPDGSRLLAVDAADD